MQGISIGTETEDRPACVGSKFVPLVVQPLYVASTIAVIQH